VCALAKEDGLSDNELLDEVDHAIDRLARVKAEIGKAIYGQEQVVELALVTMLAGGHGLLVGMPGLAKTRLVETLAAVIGMAQKRVQFTPDLMPADILGSEVLEETAEGRRAFRFIEGPIFCQLLMADEINRASPRTQAALLQAMQERRVTIAGADRPLPHPFHVLATQNPIEQEGTYPLPEAQLDRFLLEIDIHYPDLEAERQMMLQTTGAHDVEVGAVLDPDGLERMQRLVRNVPVGEQVVDAILRLVRAGRPESSDDPTLAERVAYGPGPRASQALMLTARARALLDGRLAPSTDDVAYLAYPVLKHRMALTFGARADGLTLAEVVDDLVQRIVSA
jgi:MoxR-like ATPase